MRTGIIPSSVTLRQTSGPHELDLEAICTFAATGFFLGADSYYRDERALQPATEYAFDKAGRISTATAYWSWHHNPRDMSLAQAVDEFTDLFERIVRDQATGHRVILPLSGGLDSRTQACALRDHPEVATYSYKFDHSFDETKYGALIARASNWPFTALTIPRGYLWRVIDELAELNQCQAEFTHPRQMAVIDEVAGMGDLFSLGHWGDVLFDDMGVRGDLPFAEQVTVVIGKIVKQGGAPLASALWRAWGLNGEFDDYLRDRVTDLLAAIRIDDANARIRAFKSMYWAPRWTTVNLAPFVSRHPVELPYYHDEMCKFVCTVPERHLAGRQIQIEYLKRRAPALARIPWQSVDPLDLFTYRDYYGYRMLPRRAVAKAQRMFRATVLRERLVKRNWELQFVGPTNAHNLGALLSEPTLAELVPPEIVASVHDGFRRGDQVAHAHAVSILLTLACFARARRSEPATGGVVDGRRGDPGRGA